MLSEIKKYPNWVAYRLDWSEKKGKFEKRPVNPMTGDFARANDSATWGSYDDAAAAVEKFGANGVGFEFSSPFAGIDLDNCMDDNGNLKDWAADVIRTMDSYTEFSPSGHGLHILFRGEILKEFTDAGKQGTKVGDIELYYGGRFFTVTERPYGEVKPIQERTEQAHEVYLKYMRKKTEPHNPVSDESDTYLTDSEILEKMFNSLTRGEKFRRLYGGDISDYPSHSEADMALCHELAFYTRKNATQIDRIFRGSGLMSDKWDRPTAGSTYGAITIDKAIASTHDNYGRSERTQGQERKKTSNRAIPVGDRLKDFYASVRRTKEGDAISTGFENLDEILDGGFYPGLYFLGANSSLGKTSFLIQIADFIAKSGHKVLYFSLEMSANELIAKSLSRLSYLADIERGKSTRDILTARNFDKNDSELIRSCLKEYHDACGKNLIVMEGIGDVKVDNIRQEVETLINKTGETPVVIIDYAQIISPVSDRKTDKQNVDYNIIELKRLSRDFGLPVIGISSFNRESYKESVSMASFKESGAIEYSSDVLIGLQYEGWDKKKKETKAGERYETDSERLLRLDEIGQKMDAAAAKGQAQQIELKILKNRNGIRKTLNFDFYPRYNYFEAM